MTTPIRGLHLYGNRWIGAGTPEVEQKHDMDLCFIDQIGNLNSVKTAIFSYKDQTPEMRTFWLQKQRDKLSEMRGRLSLSGNQTFVFRCWPLRTGGDFIDAGGGSIWWYQSGEQFAMNLADAFYHIKFNLGIQNAFMEVGNEPNLTSSDPDVEPFNGDIKSYNDFLRGLYYGQQQVGYSFPLIYAGLSPAFDPNRWYTDGWVQSHIRQWAVKVGIHIYWQPGGREQEFQSGAPAGRYYRWIKRTLEAAGVGPKGLMITEFGTPRRAWGGDAESQVADECTWWQGTYQDAQRGYWTEQAFLYVSNADDPADQLDYVLQDCQTDNIQSC